MFIPVSGLPLAITYDFEEKLIFWSEFNPRRSPKSVIKKAKFDGTGVEIVVNATEGKRNYELLLNFSYRHA